jgi:acetyl esterase
MSLSANISPPTASSCCRSTSACRRGALLETVADVNFGIRFFKANAERFAARSHLVGGLGTSSGGHLLLLNALRPRDPRYAAIPLAGADASLAFAVVCWSVADPLARYCVVRERGNDRLVEAHHQFWPSEEAMSEGNPQLILERGEATETPPALICRALPMTT